MFNTAGLYLLFSARMIMIKHHMNTLLLNMPTERFEKIVMEEQDYREALVENNEIRVEGKMYDVGKVVHFGSKVELLVIRDTLEEHLFSFLNHKNLFPFQIKLKNPLSLLWPISGNSFLQPQIGYDPVFTQDKWIMSVFSMYPIPCLPKVAPPPRIL